jgi:hypothetical protein
MTGALESSKKKTKPSHLSKPSAVVFNKSE